MAQKIGELEVTIGADTGPLKKAENEVKGSTKRMEASFNAVGSAIAAAFSIEAARQILMIADNMVRLEGRLKRLFSTTSQFNSAWEELTKISNEVGVSLDSTATIFERMLLSTENMGKSSGEVLRFTESLTKLSRVSGATSEETSNALIQLSQAMATGIVRGEEFNSVMEQTPEIMRVVARNIEGVDGDIGKLRQAMLDGVLSSEVFFDALQKGASDVDEQFAKLPRTIEQASQALSNNFARAISALDSQLGASTAIADFIDKIADAASATEYFLSKFEETRVNQISSQMQEINDQIKDLESQVENTDSAFGRFWNDVTGGTNNAEVNKQKIAELRAEYSKLGDELRNLTFGDRKGGEPLELSITPKISDEPVRLPEATQDTKKQEQELKKQEESAQATLDAIYLASLNQKDRLLALETQQLDEIQSLYEQEAISYEQYQTALTQTGEEFAKRRVNAEEESIQAVSMAYDALNRNIADSLASALVGTQSWADSMRSILSNLASQLIEAGLSSAFGQQASAGNIFANAFAGAAGAGRAFGGQTSGSLAHPINERGDPEILEMSGRQYLLPTGKGGKISPMESAQGGQPNISMVNMGTPMQVEAVSMDSGEIRIMIDDAIKRYDNALNSSLASGTGKTAKSLQAGYNVTRNLGVR